MTSTTDGYGVTEQINPSCNENPTFTKPGGVGNLRPANKPEELDTVFAPNKLADCWVVEPADFCPLNSLTYLVMRRDQSPIPRPEYLSMTLNTS